MSVNEHFLMTLVLTALSVSMFLMGLIVGRKIGRDAGHMEAWRVVHLAVGKKLKTPLGTVKVEANTNETR